jgi:ADP-heptose:LPS heptosyltransferase
MASFLIFRTDRIGDFIFSRVLTESIKQDNPNHKIDFVCSSYNSNYVKHFRDINKIYILDKYNIRLMIKNLFNINKQNYDYLIILDGKRRSVFFSLLLKSKFKIAVLKDFRPKMILSLFFDHYFINSEINSQFENFGSVINYLDLKVPKKINYFNNYKLKNINFGKLPKKFTLLHLDEKWFEGHYYNDFKYMNLNEKNFSFLVSTIRKKFKKNIIITSGKMNISQFNKIIDNFFLKKNNNLFISKKYKTKLIYIDKTNFRDLESIVYKSSEVICCEGAISHVSNVFQKKTVALVNYQGVNTGIFWTKHMPKIKLIFRDDVKKVCSNLIKLKI